MYADALIIFDFRTKYESIFLKKILTDLLVLTRAKTKLINYSSALRGCKMLWKRIFIHNYAVSAMLVVA